MHSGGRKSPRLILITRAASAQGPPFLLHHRPLGVSAALGHARVVAVEDLDEVLRSGKDTHTGRPRTQHAKQAVTIGHVHVHKPIHVESVEVLLSSFLT
jgi:hypothetical protein